MKTYVSDIPRFDPNDPANNYGPEHDGDCPAPGVGVAWDRDEEA